VSAPSSRIARLMRPILGPSAWEKFVQHANSKFKENSASVFQPPSGVLCCVGTRDGSECPHSFKVDLRSSSAYDQLERMHLDHEQDVRVTCDMWRRALPPHPKTWDSGAVDGGLLCHLLVGVLDCPIYGPRCVRFRCGPPREWESGNYCHELRLPHYEHLRDVSGVDC